VGSAKSAGDVLNFQVNLGVDQLHTQPSITCLNCNTPYNSIDSLGYSMSDSDYEFGIPCVIEQKDSFDFNIINSVGKIVFNSVD
jgi:hypothetical protein